VCCGVLRCVAVCCNVLQCAIKCCSVLQCVAARPDPSALVGDRSADAEGQQMGGCVLQCVAVCCSVS